MEKANGKKAEEFIMAIISTWGHISDVNRATHQEDMLGIDFHYKWDGIQSQCQVKHISWWKDMEARRDTYLLIKRTQIKHPEFDNVWIILYLDNQKNSRWDMKRPEKMRAQQGFKIAMMKRVDEIWDFGLETLYQSGELGE